ncbi:MAG TPA: hypothetical protein VE818_04365 [Nitrososphaeraceae archaeon]|jgi:hypothetical protein|nr:hypothetical protein [Nitrososphaeraceae archaeon]
MTNNILKTIGRHKQIIVLSLAVVAIASYMFPIDNMYGIAKAAAQSSNHNRQQTTTFKATNEAENRCSGGSTCLAGAQQTLLFPSGVPGFTSFSFSNEAENRCSGGSFCQAQAIQYGFFGSA